MTALDRGATVLAGRTVLLLADLDRGIGARLVATARALCAMEARVVVLSGLGDPRGDINPVLSLAPMAAPLNAATGRPVIFIRDCVGAIAEAALDEVQPGAIALMENLRFHRGESDGALSFAHRLALHGDLFADVREHPLPGRAASIRVLPTLLPRLVPEFDASFHDDAPLPDTETQTWPA